MTPNEFETMRQLCSAIQVDLFVIGLALWALVIFKKMS